MNIKIYSAAVALLALTACESPYSNWKMPNVVRNQHQQTAPKATTPASTQVQPSFKKPSPEPTQQVQPKMKKKEVKPARKRAQQIQPQLKIEETKPEPIPEHLIQQTRPQPEVKKEAAPQVVKEVVAPKPVIEAPKKSTVATASLPNTQVQPTFEQPKPQGNKPKSVMTQAQKEQYPVMPGQNRALKRRR